jgi:hypothetical protein
MARRRDEGLPVALATQGGLLAALAVLLLGLVGGGRAWIVLIQAACAFLVASGVLKILTAAVMQGIRMKADVPRKEPPDEIEETIRTISETSLPTPETTEQVAS